MKSIVLLSGGIDSTVALAREVAEFGREEALALSFDYDQKHGVQELRAGGDISVHYRVRQNVIWIDLSDFRSSLLVGRSGEMQGAATVVPARNLILLSYAAGLAESVGAERVVIGSHAGDAAIYPDCRNKFFDALNRTLRLGMLKPPRIIHPFTGLTKKQVVELGRSLCAPLELTWSCYQPRDGKPCGECGACGEREKALCS